MAQSSCRLTVGDGAVIAAGRRRQPRRAALYGRRRRSGRARSANASRATSPRRLLRIAWWNWPDEELFARLADFRSGRIEQFCARYDPLAVREPTRLAAR